MCELDRCPLSLSLSPTVSLLFQPDLMPVRKLQHPPAAAASCLPTAFLCNGLHHHSLEQPECTGIPRIWQGQQAGPLQPGDAQHVPAAGAAVGPRAGSPARPGRQPPDAVVREWRAGAHSQPGAFATIWLLLPVLDIGLIPVGGGAPGASGTHRGVPRAAAGSPGATGRAPEQPGAGEGIVQGACRRGAHHQHQLHYRETTPGIGCCNHHLHHRLHNWPRQRQGHQPEKVMHEVWCVGEPGPEGGQGDGVVGAEW